YVWKHLPCPGGGGSSSRAQSLRVCSSSFKKRVSASLSAPSHASRLVFKFPSSCFEKVRPAAAAAVMAAAAATAAASRTPPPPPPPSPPLPHPSAHGRCVLSRGFPISPGFPIGFLSGLRPGLPAVARSAQRLTRSTQTFCSISFIHTLILQTVSTHTCHTHRRQLDPGRPAIFGGFTRESDVVMNRR
ncbi:hypothetical protein T492DRAFT_1129363, partial [Pavlovales sp. CCMP2436]